MRFRYCCKSLSTAVAALHQNSDFSTQSVSAIFCSACDSAPLSLAPSLRRSLAPSPWGARCGGLWQRPGVRARAAVRGQLPAGPGEASLGVVAGVECLVWWTFGGRGSPTYLAGAGLSALSTGSERLLLLGFLFNSQLKNYGYPDGPDCHASCHFASLSALGGSQCLCAINTHKVVPA